MPDRRKPSSPIIGLVGGIGSGKSFVASIFEELGARVIDADRIVQNLLRTRPVRRAYARAWGGRILKPDGSVDPAKVSRIVFRDPAQRKRLHRLIHPRILREVRGELRRARGKTVVIDAPLLLETRTDRLCDALVFVDSPRKLRLERVRRSRWWSPSELARRERAQWPLSRKRARADYVVKNQGSVGKIRRQTREVWKKIHAG